MAVITSAFSVVVAAFGVDSSAMSGDVADKARQDWDNHYSIGPWVGVPDEAD